MQQIKNLLILKEIEKGYSNNSNPISAICRIERESGVYSLFLTFVNLRSTLSGEYFFYLLDTDKRLFKFPLGLRPTTKRLVLPSDPNLQKGFACALTVNKNGVPLTIAFSLTQNCAFTFYQLKSLIAENALKSIEEKPKINDLEINDNQNLQHNTNNMQEVDFNELKLTQPYDDEAVATVNYYDEQEIININNSGVEGEDGYVQFENGVLDFASQEKTQKNEEDDIRNTTKTQPQPRQEYSQQNPFYDSQRERIEKLLNSFPEYNNLKCYFPDSRFVKINYSADKYYIVGVVKEQKVEKYICYGVPATYSFEPPKQLKGYCSFIPLSLFDMKGEGFWMMFQDCIFGECVFPK